MNHEEIFDRQEKLAVEVKLARPDDWEQCRELRLLSISGVDAKMFGMTPEREVEEKNKSKEEWQTETSSDDMFSVLAWNGSKAIGLGRTKKMEDGWWIRNGFVKPEFRKMGIQPKMVALRLSEIKRRGGVKAHTGIRIDNPASIHNVQKFGFQVVAEDGEWCILEVDLTNPEVIKKIDEVLNAG